MSSWFDGLYDNWLEIVPLVGLYDSCLDCTTAGWVVRQLVRDCTAGWIVRRLVRLCDSWLDSAKKASSKASSKPGATSGLILTHQHATRTLRWQLDFSGFSACRQSDSKAGGAGTELI